MTDKQKRISIKIVKVPRLLFLGTFAYSIEVEQHNQCTYKSSEPLSNRSKRHSQSRTKIIFPPFLL